MTISTLKKASKITTTVRLDRELKRRSEEFAQANHMDFTTFLSFSLENTLQYGGKIEPKYQVTAEYARELDEMVRLIDAGEEKTY